MQATLRSGFLLRFVCFGSISDYLIEVAWMSEIGQQETLLVFCCVRIFEYKRLHAFSNALK